MTKVLVSGADGFVGKALCLEMAKKEINFCEALRRKVTNSRNKNKQKSYVVGDIGNNTNWEKALGGCDIAVHLAARTHVINEKAKDPLTEYRKINVEGTLNFARQAANKGVKRFIFISSIKVNGEASIPARPFRADDEPAPQDPYGISKFEAEIGLNQLGKRTGMEVVIIRPPLVYGPGVKANFFSLMKIIDKGVPLPLGAINNKRSFAALDNLVDLIIKCIHEPAAANQILLISDGEDLSTTSLLKRLGTAMERPVRLFPAPSFAMKKTANILGRADIARRLFGSLQVDISKTRKILGWTPPICVDEALKKTARQYLIERDS